MDLTGKQLYKLDKAAARDLGQRELDLVFESMVGIQSLIKLCGDDEKRDGLQETPFRVTKAFLEYTQGYHENPKEHLEKTFEVEHQDLVLVKDIEFYSMCEHHFAPFFGVAHVAYIPRNKITGLSKFARVVDGYAKRFQVQERLTNEIKEAVQDVLDPLGVMVVIEAKHMCMCGRGVKKATASTITSAVSGSFLENIASRAEVMSLIK